jgi:uncharacterized protein (DUF58 family)
MRQSLFPASIFRFPDHARQPAFRFISRRSGPFDSEVTLDKNRVYILPTKTGVLFGVLLIILLLGSVNYGKSLGFVLVFLLAGVGNVVMFATWRNLAGLRLRAGGGSPVFSGEEAVFAVQLENNDAAVRYSIAISQDGNEYEVVDVPADGVRLIHFRKMAEKRGLLSAGRFRLYTEYPTGLFVAWTWIELNMQCVVYPKPVARASLTAGDSRADGETVLHGDGLDEYTGLRKYQAGDSWRRVSWKAAARSEELYTKEFAGGQPELQWIDWKAIPARGTEERLSVMTRLVMDAEAGQRYYGLRMPGTELSPDYGNRHFQQCLKTLALYGHE